MVPPAPRLSQNTDSSANRKIVRELKKSDSESNPNILCTARHHLDKILLSQSEEHFNTIVESSDRSSKIDSAWLERNVAGLYSILNEREETGEPLPNQPVMEIEKQGENWQDGLSLECPDKVRGYGIQMAEEQQAASVRSGKLDRLVDRFVQMLRELNNDKVEVEM